MTGNELCIFSCDAEIRWGSGIDPWDVAYGIGQPHEVLVPFQVEAIDGVVDRDVARRNLLGQRLLVQVDDGCAEGQILRIVVLRIETHHRLALQAVVRLVFEADAYVGAAFDDALVEYGHHAHGVINGIVGVFDKSRSASSHVYRASCHIHRTEIDFGSARCRIFSLQTELVLLCYLLSLG